MDSERQKLFPVKTLSHLNPIKAPRFVLPSMDNNGEEGKRSSRRVHPQPPNNSLLSEFDEVDPDFILAISLLEQQEREFTPLPCIESESDEEEGSDGDLDDQDEEYEGYGDHHIDGYEYFSSQGIDAESFGFLEDEDEYSESEMEDDEDELDEIDPDELTYEQLLELGEIIGAEKIGLPLDQISSCLRPLSYQPVDLKTSTDRCVICQVEYGEGEKLVALACEHPYHSECISQWLQVKKMCPICGTEVSAPANGVAPTM